MGDVLVICEEKLQLVTARRKRNFSLSLPRAEVQVVLVIRDWLIERGKLKVNDKMMMPGVRFFDAGRCYSHSG